MNASAKTILVADDQEFELQKIKGFLKDTQYTIHTARDGLEAWEQLSKSPALYSAVLLDRLMPNMDGLTVLKKMKTNRALKKIPVIFQTIMKAENEISEGIEAGAYYYLAKPFRKQILKTILKTAITEHDKYQSLNKQTAEITNAAVLLKNGSFEFRTLEEGQKLSTLLGRIYSGSKNVVYGLWELVANAVEHGNLGITYDEKSMLNENDQLEDEIRRRMKMPEYAKKTVSFKVEKTDDEIRFTIQDQGEGFEWEKYMDYSAERVFDSHGRGIAMANKECFDRLEYQGNGNCVVAVCRI